jgi:uncharacterized protein
MAAPREVSEEDLTLLEGFLMSERAPADCMQLSDLDGFLTGIVIGPERIAPEEWMPLVWNGEPEFETPAERARILGIVLARHEEVLWTLTQSPEEFAPILWQDDDGEPIAEDWAEGFLAAIRLRPEAWTPLFESKDHGVLLAPIAALWEDDELEAELDDAEAERMRTEATELLPAAVIAIFRFWRRQRPPGETSF